MTQDQIEHFLLPENLSPKQVKINFKNRNPVMGLFIELKDFHELKTKNFWRVVTEKNFEAWHKSKDPNLVKIFNGSEFTRLVIPKVTAASATPA
jgi:hypothetical protein